MLDWSVQKDEDRVETVKKELLDESNKLTRKTLETFANYILYGKDENGQNAEDRKEVTIDKKYSSYAKKQSSSLNELMEDPNFDERGVKPLGRKLYTNPKPKLDLNNPELQPLLETIAQYQAKYDEATSPEYNGSMTQTQIYKLKHLLIDLKRQQYTIQNELRQVRTFSRANEMLTRTPEIELIALPLGFKTGELTRFTSPRTDTSKYQIPTSGLLDYENPKHIYEMIEEYSILLEASIANPSSNEKLIIDTLDFYINLVGFDESRKIILENKKYKIPNSLIKEKLTKELGLHHNENYISTIYTKEICRKIAETATLHKDYWLNRQNKSKWKKCSCCGEWRMRDSRDFVKKSASPDGYSTRCKHCDKKKRQGGKIVA